MIFENLVTTDSVCKPGLILAKSTDISDDSKTDTFHLRQGVKFKKFIKKVDRDENSLADKKRIAVEIFLVPDTSSRLAGLHTGKYDSVYGIPNDSYDMLQIDSNLDKRTHEADRDSTELRIT